MFKNLRIFPRPIARLGIIFGILPNYDFEKKKIVSGKIHKLWIIFLVITVTAFMMLGTYVHYLKVEILPLVETVGLLVDVTDLISFVWISLRCSFWNTDVWQELLHHLYRLRFASNSIVEIGKLPIAVFVIKNTYLAAVVIYGFYNLENLRIFFPVNITLFYNRVLILYLILTTVLLIKKTYKNAIGMLSKINRCSVVNNDANNALKNILGMYMETDNIVNAFNDIFGWPLLLTLARSVLRLLYTLTLYVEGRVRGKMNSVLEQCSSLIVILCCDSTVEESNRLLKNCFRMENSLQPASRERAELRRLCDIIENKRICFKAADFFEIQRSTILAILATTTTYMIVILQFNYV